MWDVTIINSKHEVELDEGWYDKDDLPPFGNPADVAAKITAVYPETDWSHPNYGYLENDDIYCNISLGMEEDMVYWITFHVYSRVDDNPYDVLEKICKVNHWKMFDSGINRYIGPSEYL